jgi:hypothetical protein
MAAAAPPKVTDVAKLKFAPNMVTVPPPAVEPLFGEMLLIVGGTAIAFTVNKNPNTDNKTIEKRRKECVFSNLLADFGIPRKIVEYAVVDCVANLLSPCFSFISSPLFVFNS